MSPRTRTWTETCSCFWYLDGRKTYARMKLAVTVVNTLNAKAPSNDTIVKAGLRRFGESGYVVEVC